MRKFLLFLAGLAAAIIIIANIGPMVLLGVSLWLVYLVFKQFIKATTTVTKIGWILVGLVILTVTISNLYAIIGIGAGFVLYIVFKHWKDEPEVTPFHEEEDDPFVNFEHQWGELTK